MTNVIISESAGKHWRQWLSVTIIRGRVMVVTVAAARERGRGNGEAPEEISAHSLGYTASSDYTSATDFTAFRIEWHVSKRGKGRAPPRSA
jgi:hypothetical protein